MEEYHTVQYPKVECRIWEYPITKKVKIEDETEYAGVDLHIV
jgi:hypothetical protein